MSKLGPPFGLRLSAGLGQLVERRGCCGTRLGQPHREDCREHPLGRRNLP